jgi:carbamoyltransferase
MKLLSIMWGTNSTAALMVDGEILACVSEERFSRIKNDERYPRQAIEAVLRMGGVEGSELDAVAFAGYRFDAKAVLAHKYSGFSVQDRMREQQDYWGPRLLQRKTPSFLDVFRDKIDVEQFGGDWNVVLDLLRREDAKNEDSVLQAFRRRAVCSHLGIPPEKVSFVHHHRAHGFYAYYASSIRKDRVVILTADAWGDDCNATVSLAEGARITRLSSSNDFLPARLYRSITLLLGMKPDEHEYKVMGLAGYAKEDHLQGPLAVFQNTQFVNDLGFGYREKPSDLYFYFKEKLEGFRFDSIAGAVQAYTEGILTQWAGNALKATGARRIVFGGGAGMNVKAMMTMAMLPEVEDLMVCPTPSDESLAIGAAYVYMHDALTEQGRDPLTVLRPIRDAYQGPALSTDDVAREADSFRRDPAFAVTDNPRPAQLAQVLAEGMVLGRCVGRSEFGARALGNRSILADPRRISVVRKINEKVKSRDFWMPFAPTILAHRADQYLIGRKGMAAPYMTQAFHTSRLAHEELPAAIHQGDFTCRPQILSEKGNPAYHALVQAFEQRTGVGGVLNTSFNLHGEPIVQSAAEAARVFRVSDLDALILDNILITKASLPA